MDALDNMTKDLSSEESLLHKMVALHLVYKRCCSELYQFRQLVQHRPGILQDKNLLTDDNHVSFKLVKCISFGIAKLCHSLCFAM